MGGGVVTGILNMPAPHLIGWALVHSLWIGALVAGAVVINLRVLAGRPAVVRYGVACGALVVLAAVPLQLSSDLKHHWDGHRHYIWMIQNGVRYETGVGHVPDPDAGAQPTASAIRARHDASMTPWLEGTQAVAAGQLLSILALLWMGGVVVQTLRAGRDWGAVRRLRQDTESVPEEWASALSRLAVEMDVALPVTMARSRHVEVPSLIGWRRPMILLPTWLADDRPMAEIEAIAAHELAHVRRHDFLVNAIQSVTDVLLFYNPAYWWVADRVREEREFCCDDIATSNVSGGVRAYLESLVSLEGHRPSGRVSHALALTDGDLVRRVRRLASTSSNRQRGAHAVIDPVAFLLATALLCAPLGVTEVAARHASGALMKQDLELAVMKEEGWEGTPRSDGWPDGLMPRHEQEGR